MKLTKRLIKKGLKNQGVAILYMLSFNFISSFIFLLENIGIKPTGKTVGSLISLTEYKANLFFVTLSSILFVVLFIIFYNTILKPILKKQNQIHLIFTILFLIIIFIFIFIELILKMYFSSYSIGFFSHITNYPKYLNSLILIFLVLYILIDFIKEMKSISNIKLK